MSNSPTTNEPSSEPVQQLGSKSAYEQLIRSLWNSETRSGLYDIANGAVISDDDERKIDQNLRYHKHLLAKYVYVEMKGYNLQLKLTDCRTKAHISFVMKTKTLLAMQRSNPLELM